MQSIIRQAQRVIVKVGSSLVTNEGRGLDHAAIAKWADQIAHLRRIGKQVVLVSSGAVGAGMGRLGLTRRPTELAKLQAVAAIGQSCLIEAYERALRGRGRHVAQVLLVADDLQDRSRYLNIRTTLLTLLDLGAIPVINENDTVSVEELRTSFGDNDRLAALVATVLGAPLLVLLSDVEGLFDRHPSEPGAAIVPHVPRIDATVAGLAKDTLGGLSKGGMASKIAAARIVTEAGGSCIVASGRDDGVIEAICRGEPIGTLFTGRSETMPAWKRWLGWSADARGTVAVDAGAREAVVAGGRSLLAAGIRSLDGDFAAGDVVALADDNGQVFARGLVNYASADLRRIVGLRTERIAEVLGSTPYAEVVHRDNLAIIDRSGADSR